MRGRSRGRASTWSSRLGQPKARRPAGTRSAAGRSTTRDRKSTRLNSSHVEISYAVFCLKKKKKKKKIITIIKKKNKNKKKNQKKENRKKNIKNTSTKQKTYLTTKQTTIKVQNNSET